MVPARSWRLCCLGTMLVLFACSSESPTETDEYKQLEEELAQAQAALGVSGADLALARENLASSEREVERLAAELAQSDQDAAEKEQELRDAQETLDLARERLEDLVVRDLVDDTLIIRPTDWRRYSVLVKDWMDSPKIELEFEIVSGRDVEVMVFEDVPYKNWAAGVSAAPIYFSGRVAAGTRTVRLSGPGTYHVVVSNRFSSALFGTTKTVEVTARFTAQIEL